MPTDDERQAAGLSEEEQSALSAVAQQAHERYGHHPGFDAILAFIPHSHLQQAFPDCSTMGLTGKAIGVRLANYLKERDELDRIIEFALRSALGPASDSGHLAERILAQMDSDTKLRPTYRKPVQYIAGASTGLAVALVIDDRFWTDLW